MLAVDGAQFGDQRRLDLARVARVSGRTFTPRIPGDVVQHALAAVLALFRTQLLLAPVAVDGQRFRTLAPRSAGPLVHSARADYAIPVAHTCLTVAANVSGRALARPVGRVQHAVVLADVPQRLVRYHHGRWFRLSRGDVLQKHNNKRTSAMVRRGRVSLWDLIIISLIFVVWYCTLKRRETSSGGGGESLGRLRPLKISQSSFKIKHDSY